MKSLNKASAVGAWLALMLLSLAALSWRLLDGVSVQTDIRALLPAAKLAPALQTAIDAVQEQALGQHLLLLGSAHKEQLPRALEGIRQQLANEGAWQLQAWDQQGIGSHALYLQHPYRVMADGDEILDSTALVQRALSRLYSLSGLASRTRFQEDPFGILAAWLDQRPSYSPFTLQADCLHRKIQEQHWCLIRLQASSAGMGLEQTAARVASLDRALQAAKAATPDLQTYDAGVSRHADFAATTAKHEFSLISLGTLSGIVILLGLLLRSLSALLLACLVLSAGGLVGLSVCLLLYPQPHLIALVFGACLLGVAVDYAFHFLCANGTGLQRSSAIANGLRLGWLTTSAGFAFLLLAPFDSLRQVAVFAVSGLSGAYLTVRWLLPQLPERWLSQPSLALLNKIAVYWPTVAKPQRAILIVALVIMLSSLLLAKDLESQENVRALHAGSASLLQQETQARGLIDSIDAAQLFIVQANSDEALLRSGAALDQALQSAVQQGHLRRFMSLNQVLPNYAAQEHAYQHWAKTIFAPGAALDALKIQLNLPAEWVEGQRQLLASSKPIPLNIWQQSATSWPQAELLVTTHPGENRWALLRMGGITNLNALNKLAQELRQQGHQIQFYDPLAAASQGLSSARQAAMKVLGLALLAVLIILVLRYGLAPGLISSLPVALAISVSLAGLALREQHFSLFCVFALLLVVGMAIDYGLFVREGPTNDVHCLLAVSLSALTTLLAFGLLGLSSTPALKDFGFIVTLGIGSAWLATLLLHRAGWMNKS